MAETGIGSDNSGFHAGNTFVIGDPNESDNAEKGGEGPPAPVNFFDGSLQHVRREGPSDALHSTSSKLTSGQSSRNGP